nr:hypothetical protein [Candidatus Baldrarchaeota archaeon]
MVEPLRINTIYIHILFCGVLNLSEKGSKTTGKEILEAFLLISILMYLIYLTLLSGFDVEGVSVQRYLLGRLVFCLLFALIPTIYFGFTSLKSKSENHIAWFAAGFYGIFVVEPFNLWLYSLINGYVELMFIAWILAAASYLVAIPSLTFAAAKLLEIKFSEKGKKAFTAACIIFTAAITALNFNAKWFLNLDHSYSIAQTWIIAIYIASAVCILSGILAHEVEKSGVAIKASQHQQRSGQQ